MLCVILCVVDIDLLCLKIDALTLFMLRYCCREVWCLGKKRVIQVIQVWESRPIHQFLQSFKQLLFEGLGGLMNWINISHLL